MKRGRDIARGKGHLVHEFDLKLPLPWEMAASFRVWNHIFVHFSNSILAIPMKFGREIASLTYKYS